MQGVISIFMYSTYTQNASARIYTIPFVLSIAADQYTKVFLIRFYAARMYDVCTMMGYAHHVGIAFSSCQMIHTKTYEYKVLDLFLLQCTKWLLNLMQRFEFYMFIIMNYFQIYGLSIFAEIGLNQMWISRFLIWPLNKFVSMFIGQFCLYTSKNGQNFLWHAVDQWMNTCWWLVTWLRLIPKWLMQFYSFPFIYIFFTLYILSCLKHIVNVSLSFFFFFVFCYSST